MPTDFFRLLAHRILSPGRMAKYFRGLLAGYGGLGVTIVFTAVTVPMGISSLGLAGWGVWVFCQQASAAICLFESFTQSAYVRLLVQVKDDTSSESYKRMVWMGRWSFWFQGVLLFAFHGAFALTLPLLFPNFSGTDGWQTICVMGLASLINQAGKINGQLLYAHQHQDRASLAATAGLLVNLLVVVVGLPKYPSAQTMAWAFLVGSLAGQFCFWGFARLSKCWPSFSGNPSIKVSDFRPLWFWGRQFFLFSFLGNLSNNLPTLIAGRFLPPESVGIWGVLQRISNMMSQALLKFPQLAVPALMEMHAQGDDSRFKKRSYQVLWAQNVFAGFALGAFSSCGDFLIKIWLGDTILTSPWVLPLFALMLLADFDQRLRFDIETIRLEMRRPLAAALLKNFCIVILVTLLGQAFGLPGMVFGLLGVFMAILLPLSLFTCGFKKAFLLPAGATFVGFACFFASAAVLWAAKFFLFL